ncbi:hypothetical protein C4K14_4195 [Pseudomonas chlororaphis subsp. aureofaciens]|nr:hypothetical protein C4K14_4195 [Pseudomonas chlororaphis subsp. aureofaciens]
MCFCRDGKPVAYCQPFAARRPYMEGFMRPPLVPRDLPLLAGCRPRQAPTPAELGAIQE